MCFVPLDLRVSLKFMISSEKFFKTNFQATLFFSIDISNCCEERNTQPLIHVYLYVRRNLVCNFLDF